MNERIIEDVINQLSTFNGLKVFNSKNADYDIDKSVFKIQSNDIIDLDLDNIIENLNKICIKDDEGEHFCKNCVYYEKYDNENSLCNAVYDDSLKLFDWLTVTDKPTNCGYYLEAGTHKFLFDGTYRVKVKADTWCEAEEKFGKIINEEKVNSEGNWEYELEGNFEGVLE